MQDSDACEQDPRNHALPLVLLLEPFWPSRYDPTNPYDFLGLFTRHGGISQDVLGILGVMVRSLKASWPVTITGIRIMTIIC